jgi:hypothetical protein
MGMLDERGNVVKRIAGLSPRAKARCTDVYGIGAAIDGSQATGQVPGRSEQFDWECHLRHRGPLPRLQNADVGPRGQAGGICCKGVGWRVHVIGSLPQRTGARIVE